MIARPAPLLVVICLAAGLHGLSLSVHAQAPPTVAKAMAVDGTVYITRADGRQGILARGSELAVGDTLSTTRNSTVRLRFTDGGETAVRPDSRITVQAYRYDRDAPEQDNLFLSLLRGGLRALTGEIGKRGNVNAYRLNTSTATIGIRGTDYTARLCEGDCQADPGSITRSSRANSSAPVVARLVQAQGTVSVEREARQVDIVQGAPLYATDRISTSSGGSAVLAFRDDTRITLNSGTRLALAQYTFEPKEPERSGLLFRLFSGGLRIATGLIAKSAPERVKFQTSTATIGVRGTVFDISCGRAEVSDDPPPADVTDIACDQSLFASSREGRITLASNDGNEVVIAPGQTGVVPGPQGSARQLPATPAFFNTINTPEPEKVDVNVQDLFGSAAPAENAPGLYLMVRDGKVVVEQSGQVLALDAGESAYAGRSLAPVRLASAPLILDRDPSLSNTVFNFGVCRR
jgi:hypothetical protein